MIDANFAKHFAADWYDSWNTHDLPRILSHYTKDFVLSSPVIPRVVDEPSGVLTGLDAVAAYWGRGLARRPDLIHWEPIQVLAGVNSVVLYYKGFGGLNAEFFAFDATGKVTISHAHVQV